MALWSWINHHRLLTIGIATVLLVATGVAVAYLVLFRTTSTPFNLRQALRMYRREHHRGALLGAEGLPTPGVYGYSTTGHEGLSLPGASRTFPSVTPMIVSGRPCSEIRWEPVVQHVEEFTECRAPSGGVEVTSTTTLERIAGQDIRTVVTCPPGTWIRPARSEVGVRWSTTCRTGPTSVPVRGEVVGHATIDVGGDQVPAWHTRVTFYFHGAATGTGASPADYWLSASNNLILRQHETAQLSQEAGPLGSVHYTEEMTATLRSLQPAS